MNKILLTGFIFFVQLIFSCTAPKQLPAYSRIGQQPLGDPSKTALFIQLDSIKTTYINNISPVSYTELSDSFFLETANELALCRTSSIFKFKKNQELNSGKISNRKTLHFSILEKDTILKDSVCKEVKEIASINDVDYIIIPYSCEIKYSKLQPESWRNYSGSYERPVTYTATASFHLQIWSKEGKLLFEKIGYGKNRRPMFYDIFKRKKPDEDIVSYAKKLYAPPMIRALNEAVKYATKF